MTKAKTPDREVEGLRCLHCRADNEALTTAAVRTLVLARVGVPGHRSGLFSSLVYGEAEQ